MFLLRCSTAFFLVFFAFGHSTPINILIAQMYEY